MSGVWGGDVKVGWGVRGVCICVGMGFGEDSIHLSRA